MIDFDTIDRAFMQAVEQGIQDFNDVRGRRKKLFPIFIDDIPLPNRKLGRKICYENINDNELKHLVTSKMAKATVRTLLKCNPRPSIAVVGILCNTERKELLYRIKLPRVKRNT